MTADLVFAILITFDIAFQAAYLVAPNPPCGPIAQLVELPAHNRLVPGSNPGGPTTTSPFITPQPALWKVTPPPPNSAQGRTPSYAVMPLQGPGGELAAHEVKAGSFGMQAPMIGRGGMGQRAQSHAFTKNPS